MDVTRGIAEWQTAKLSYEDDKIMLTKTNLFQRLHAFRLNSDPDSDNSFVKDMTKLLNTNKYMVSTQIITQSGVIRLVAAEAMYKLIKGVQPMTERDVEDLFFTSAYSAYRPGAAQQGNRYYDPAEPQPNTSTPTATEGCLSRDNPQGPARAASAATLSPFVRRLFEARSARNASICCEAGSSAAHASEALRSDSPRSIDSGSHESDAGFIAPDDEIIDEIDDEISDEISFDDNTSVNDYDVGTDTCRPVRPDNGKGRAE